MMFEAALTAVLDAGHAARFLACGDSMHPTIRDGQAICVERCPAEALSDGEVILAQAARGLTAHRIVGIRKRSEGLEIITRGDNCLRNDPPLRAGELIGRVMGVQRKKCQSRLFDRPLTLLRLSRRIFFSWIATRPRIRWELQ
jgi:signal peptidase I